MVQSQVYPPSPHADTGQDRHRNIWLFRLPGKRRWRITTFLLLASFFSVSLSGCDIGGAIWDLIHTDGSAEAQIFTNESQRVKTFIIVTTTFLIELENEGDASPSVDVKDQATVYTMNSNGTVRFESDGQATSFDLQANDLIIERPGASGTGLITIIDAAASSP